LVNRTKRKTPSPGQERLSGAASNNLRITPAGLLFPALALVGLAIAGCGDGQSSPEAKPATATVKLTVKKPAVTLAEGDSTPAPPPLSPASVANKQTRVAKAGNVPKSHKPAHPKDVADWKRDDYESAARDGDPQLVAALDYFGPHFAGRESAANFLAQLLESSAADPVAGGTGQPTRPPYGLGNRSSAPNHSNFTEAAIAALVANGTPRARQILENIAEETLRTADKPAAAIVALKALAAYPGPETEDLLLHLVTAKEPTLADGPAARNPATLQNTAVELIRTRASESLSLRLAKWMLASDTSKASRDLLWSCLKEPRPENLAAQIMLYQSDRPDQATHAWLETWIAAYSSDALGQLLGIPPDQTDSGQSASGSHGGLSGVPSSRRRGVVLPRNIPATNANRLAELVWSSNLAAVTERRLGDLDTLGDGLSLITLAGTVPNPTVRAALLRTLERHWEEGPKELSVLSATESTNVEPGFIAAVKMLRRCDPVEVATRKDLLGHGSSHQSSAKSPAKTGKQREGQGAKQAKKTTDPQQAKHRQEQLGQEWMDFSQAVLRATCRRLHAAARAEQNARGNASRSGDDAHVPFKLPPGAEIAAVYHVNWPDDLSGKVAAAPTLRLRYMRLQQKGATAKVVAYYRRQMPHGKEHTLVGGGWIDSIVVDKEQDRAHSVDVLVTSAGKNTVDLPNLEKELTVDILTIECQGIAKPNPLSASRQ
jgi:hypothetical protein